MPEKSLGDRKRQLWQALLLVKWLSESRTGYTKAELAEKLGVHPRTISRYIGALAEVFTIDERKEDGRTYHFVEQSIGREYTSLTAVELAALQVESEARKRENAPQADILIALHTKLLMSFRQSSRVKLAPDLDVLSRQQRTAMAPGPAAQIDQHVMRTIQEAILRGCCLEVDYQGDKDAVPRHRELEPWGVILGPVSYLLGKAPCSDDPLRNFRVDRISQATLSPKSTSIPEDWNLDAWMTESFGIFHGDTHEVVLRVQPHGVARARGWRFHPRQRIEADGDGLLIRFRAGGLRELAEHLFTWGDEIRIIGPPALREMMRERIAAATAAM